MKKTQRRRKPFLLIILMIAALSLLVGGCGGGAVQPPVGAINFADPILEAAVRNAEGYTGQPTGPIYPADVLGITVLNVDGPNTQASRDGQEDGNSGSGWERLEYQILVKNEERHRRFGERGADSEPSTRGAGGLVSLEGIQRLTNLERLSFRNNQVSNLTPLQNMTNLEWLYFDNNQVSNLTPLQNLTNLEWLSFDNNQASSLIPLQNLTNLQYLDFSDNQVSSLTPLQNLTNLRELYFSNNQVSSLTPLQNLTNLKWLYFEHNHVSDITPLVNNAGIGDGDTVDMRYNYLDLNPWSIDFFNIQFLTSRGCTVHYMPQN
ncbi:MAG TPA: leucine-rich repeat domain-containing protein [Thermotogota bacterium]|nr:leucine-rich repeat domain-containing protein [Thermotogota bacterium]